MPTPREIEVLYHTFLKGYYSQPRRVALDQLTEELGLSKSTLNEILRNAERKIGLRLHETRSTTPDSKWGLMGNGLLTT